MAVTGVSAQATRRPPASSPAEISSLGQSPARGVRGYAGLSAPHGPARTGQWPEAWLLAERYSVDRPLPAAGTRPAWDRIGGQGIDPVTGAAFAVQAQERIEPGLALVASALLPGAGQYLQENDRWVPYLALEVWGWISFFDRRANARSLAGDYRDLAWFVARRVSIGERRDTIFEYYEEMTHYPASGTWDSDPEMPGVQPELDQRTFNGDLWELSRSLFFPGGINYQPGTAPYEQALGYYLRNAIPPTFTWAWGDSFLEQQSFRELIRRSDEAYRSSTQFLGLILANHVVSAVDALVIGRLRGDAGESRFRIGSRFDRAAGPAPRLRIEGVWRW